MPRKQTTPAVSSIAGKYVRMTNADFFSHFWGRTDAPALRLFRDIRKLAASVLSQDESKGQSKPKRKT